MKKSKDDQFQENRQPKGGQSGAPVPPADDSSHADHFHADGGATPHGDAVHADQFHGPDAAAPLGDQADNNNNATQPSHPTSATTNDDTSEGEVTEEVETLRMQVEAMTEALQRERADAMNVRRRADEDRLKMAGYYKAQVVKALLPALDNLERALKHVPKDLNGHDYVKGVQGVAKQFEKALADLGVERIATVGEPFDPDLHEAISMEDGDGDHEIVSEELQAGYRIGDEIVRHAMVRVAPGDHPTKG